MTDFTRKVACFLNIKFRLRLFLLRDVNCELHGALLILMADFSLGGNVYVDDRRLEPGTQTACKDKRQVPYSWQMSQT